MTTVFSARLDGSEAKRYFHFPIVGTYLEIASDAAVAAQSIDPNKALRAALICITFSVMSVEALVNELAEKIIPESDLDAFMRRSGLFKQARHKAGVIHKLLILSERSGASAVSPQLISSLEAAIELRNHLVHYKLSETAGSVLQPPAIPEVRTEGSFRMTFDLTAEPVKINPLLLEKINEQSAGEALAAAKTVINLWSGQDKNAAP
jgi:hypothetical protein